jgi:predicted outer membrane repeat protein
MYESSIRPFKSKWQSIYILGCARIYIYVYILCVTLSPSTHCIASCVAPILFLHPSNRVSNGLGGAIHTLQGSELYVEYSSFQNNFAFSGGAINSMGDLRVLESSFSNNVGTAVVRNNACF